MSIAVRPRFQYTNTDATTIAASPAWTAITSPSERPIAVLIIQTTSGASFEISLDGLSPIAWLNPESNLGGLINIPYKIDFRSNNLLLPAGTIIYARISAGATGAGERFTVTYVQEDIQSRGG